ncbi:hypothetical protein GCM10009617_02930 [Leifsonia poae]|uniref:Uncharacterized protein n=1 Tax=Leifsonia poae TaxID=110933 RepID=A0A9W6H690_9MICO|nr:hypothetical protein GCM10017584_02930 [Leifsonia poae]
MNTQVQQTGGVFIPACAESFAERCDMSLNGLFERHSAPLAAPGATVGAARGRVAAKGRFAGGRTAPFAQVDGASGESYPASRKGARRRAREGCDMSLKRPV